MEEALAEALTTYQKPTDEDGGYVRQSSVKYVKYYIAKSCAIRASAVKPLNFYL